ncbi:metalloendoproteinase 3-MMP-like [Salvia hispanica]|uniref:metalloendoproteinase 3-MMP-like n=1 Tax=Salvia hispanica TaxID=49212 RepID=UPI0020097A3A|nr:metalloendoproteinase 3-MMP-like [Salvia hispanica]
MALKLLNILSIVLLLVVFLLSVSSGTKGNSMGFELVKVPTANTIQLFDSEFHLQRYGYYEYAQLNLGTGASEDQILELAIKTYQGNFGIKPTGILDDQTLLSMMAPRCGNPDIDIGVNSMNPHNRNLTAQL